MGSYNPVVEEEVINKSVEDGSYYHIREVRIPAKRITAMHCLEDGWLEGWDDTAYEDDEKGIIKLLSDNNGIRSYSIRTNAGYVKLKADDWAVKEGDNYTIYTFDEMKAKYEVSKFDLYDVESSMSDVVYSLEDIIESFNVDMFHYDCDSRLIQSIEMVKLFLKERGE